MGTKHRARIAFCTVFLLVLVTAVRANGAAEDLNRDLYLKNEISNGAIRVPVLARIAYHDALKSIAAGARDEAERELRRALTYDPDYPDAYFTLARLKVRRLEPDAPTYLIEGFSALWRNFRVQKYVALGGAATLALVLLTLSLAICVALAIKYLPYVAHKLKEFLEKRFNAAAPAITAYLILLTPLLLVPGPVVGLIYLMLVCWLFMHRRERLLVAALIIPLVLVGIIDLPAKGAATLSDPKSLTSLVARANDSGGDEYLIRSIERSGTPETETEKNLALGLLHLKGRRFHDASEHLFKAIAQDPERKMGYINLGNVHFLQGEYEKALQGYRKAEKIDPLDPVCQFDLAQAYIATLLMKKASHSLQLASNNGIEEEKSSYAAAALDLTHVMPKRFSNEELWRLALTEARSLPKEQMKGMVIPLARVPRKAAAWLLLVAFAIALVLTKVINPAKLTFQCSSCGRLTCENCCSNERDMSLCKECAKTIETVTSEKVVEALLRQKRQTELVRRRRSARLITRVLPGVRDVYYERILRGVGLAGLFSLSIVCLFTKCSIVQDPMTLLTVPPLWKTVLPAIGIAVSFLISGMAKPSARFRPQRHSHARSISGETKAETSKSEEVA
ncbi:MAG: tetratricopeptide repeat protein [Candidatus Latescibacterota bacterium]|nr:MAG: tetratricopeptide repeat protein [Candidatus Latescibacterota bacterium]